MDHIILKPVLYVWMIGALPSKLAPGFIKKLCHGFVIRDAAAAARELGLGFTTACCHDG